MQNEQKPMKQSRNIDQKPNFGPNLGLNGPNFGPQFIFDDWNHKYQLEIIIAYHYVQNTKNLTSKSREIEFGDINKSQDHSIIVALVLGPDSKERAWITLIHIIWRLNRIYPNYL